MTQAIFQFDLKLGEAHTFTGKSGEHYTLTAETFGVHDHKAKPLYYYYPEKIEDNDSEQVVLCMEDDLHDESYSSPYAGTIEGSFDLYRRHYVFACELQPDRSVRVNVYELKEQTNENRKATWPFGELNE